MTDSDAGPGRTGRAPARAPPPPGRGPRLRSTDGGPLAPASASGLSGTGRTFFPSCTNLQVSERPGRRARARAPAGRRPWRRGPAGRQAQSMTPTAADWHHASDTVTARRRTRADHCHGPSHGQCQRRAGPWRLKTRTESAAAGGKIGLLDLLMSTVSSDNQEPESEEPEVSRGITDDWSIRGWILAMGGFQIAIIPLEVSSRYPAERLVVIVRCEYLTCNFHSWTFITIGNYAHMPSVPLIMGIATGLVIAGAVADNFLAAYVHGMIRYRQLVPEFRIVHRFTWLMRCLQHHSSRRFLDRLLLRSVLQEVFRTSHCRARRNAPHCWIHDFIPRPRHGLRSITVSYPF
jgi:hypothetical protein